MSVFHAHIVEAASGQLVDAELHDTLSPEVLLDIEEQWMASRESVKRRLHSAGIPAIQWPQSGHWDWGRKSIYLTLAGDRDSYRIFGVCRQMLWEGVMVTQRKQWRARLAPDTGKSLIYVDFLEVAPWNWSVKPIDQARRHKGIGPLLLGAAVEQSLAEGYCGRVGLHALPQAEEFYRSMTFAAVAQDVDKGLPYYELTAEAAAAFRKGR